MDYIEELSSMPNRTLLLLKSVANSCYAGMMRKKGEASQAVSRAPITIAEHQDQEPARRKSTKPRQDEPDDVTHYLSEEEKAFMQQLKLAFQLQESDLHLFHLVAHARQTHEQEMRRNPNLKQAETPQPDFSPEFLSLLMECVQPTPESSRGYYAAMLHLKKHPVPTAWQADGKG